MVYNVQSSNLVPPGHVILEGLHQVAAEWGIVWYEATILSDMSFGLESHIDSLSLTPSSKSPLSMSALAYVPCIHFIPPCIECYLESYIPHTMVFLEWMIISILASGSA